MINVSSDLKKGFNPNDGKGARTIDWSLRFAVVNNEAAAQMTPSAEEDTQISRLSQTLDGNTAPLNIATFEYKGFPLDGSAMVPPTRVEAPEVQVGLIMNELSDGNGVYASPQVYTAEMINQFDLIGITIDWGHSPASDFKVEWYRQNTLVNIEEAAGNKSSNVLLNTPVDLVDKVVVTVTKSMLPYRRCRIAEFIPGAVKVYDKSNAEKMDIQEVIDPFNERVTASDLKLIADNFAHEFNIFDPTGIYKYFQERQQILPSIGALKQNGQYEYVDMGVYYLQRPSLKGNLAKLELSAVNRLGLLQNTVYSKGKYRTGTVAGFVDEIAADAGVPVKYPVRFSAASMTAYIETMSHAIAFQKIAQAMNTTLSVGRDDVVTFVETSNEVLQTITQDDYRMENGFVPSDDEIYNTVHVECSNLSIESAETELGRTKAEGTITSTQFYVDNGVVTTTQGVYRISYSPSVNQTAKLVSGEIVISGYLINNTVTIAEASIKRDNEQAYIYEVGENVFIQTSNADQVAEHMLNIAVRCRRMVKVEYRGYPYIEVGDTLNFNVGGGETQPFFVSKNKLSLGGGMVGTLEAREQA